MKEEGDSQWQSARESRHPIVKASRASGREKEGEDDLSVPRCMHGGKAGPRREVDGWGLRGRPCGEAGMSGKLDAIRGRGCLKRAFPSRTIFRFRFRFRFLAAFPPRFLWVSGPFISPPPLFAIHFP